MMQPKLPRPDLPKAVKDFTEAASNCESAANNGHSPNESLDTVSAVCQAGDKAWSTYYLESFSVPPRAVDLDRYCQPISEGFDKSLQAAESLRASMTDELRDRFKNYVTDLTIQKRLFMAYQGGGMHQLESELAKVEKEFFADSAS